MRVDIPVRLLLLFGISLLILCCHLRGLHSGLVIEVFEYLDKVGADVLLHGYPQRCIPNPTESLLEVYEDMVEVLLVLEIFLT